MWTEKTRKLGETEGNPASTVHSWRSIPAASSRLQLRLSRRHPLTSVGQTLKTTRKQSPLLQFWVVKMMVIRKVRVLLKTYLEMRKEKQTHMQSSGSCIEACIPLTTHAQVLPRLRKLKGES
jgi:hypothetical protein